MVCGLGVTVHSSATQWINTEEMGIPCLLTFSYSIVTIQNKLHFANNPNLHPVLVKEKICCYQSCCEKSIHGLYNNSGAKWWRLLSSIRAKLSTAFLYLQSFKADLVQSRFGPESWGKVNFQNFEVFRTEVPRSGSSLMRNSLCIWEIYSTPREYCSTWPPSNFLIGRSMIHRKQNLQTEALPENSPTECKNERQNWISTNLKFQEKNRLWPSISV